MRKVTLLSVCLAAFAADAALFDPEDQIRYFCRPHEAYFGDVIGMGFNVIEHCFWGGKYDGTSFDADCTAIRQRYMDRFANAGVRYLEFMPTAPGLPHRFARRQADGRAYGEGNPDVALPEVRDYVRKMARTYALSISNHPAFFGVQPTAEVRDQSRISFTPEMTNAFRRATGLEIPEGVKDRRPPHYRQIEGFPADRIVPLDFPLFRFYSWWWKTGDGWNDYQGDVAAEYDRVFGRRVFSMYDPSVRVPPIWGSGGDVTHIGQWTYLDPEPFALMHVVSEQQAMARGRDGQGVVTMLQGMCYRSRTAPKDRTVGNPPAWTADRPLADYITVPPDLMREGIWLAMARKLDGIGVFAWKSLFDADAYGYPKDKGGYQFTNPETARVIGETFNAVACPLGPFLRRLEERSPEVAVLESSASWMFAKRGSMGWGRGPIVDVGLAALLAHYQPGVLYEEDLAKDGVPANVKVLLTPHCDVVTEPTARAIAAFRRRGGFVFTDEFLAPGVEADALLPTFVRKGTAEEDKAGLRAMAEALREKLLRLNVHPHADSGSPELLTWVREADRAAECLFVVNDRRGAGDYVGQWGLVHEKGLPNAGQVAIARKAGAVYDLVRHQPAVHSVDADGWTSIPVSFPTTGGAMFLVADRPLSPLSVSVKKTDGGVSFTVTSPDADVSVPFEWRLERGPRTVERGFGVLKGGVCGKAFRIADPFERIVVTSLADGLNVSEEITESAGGECK